MGKTNTNKRAYRSMKQLLLFPLAGLVFLSSNVSATSMEERLLLMEQRLNALEQRVLEQETQLQKKDEEIARLQKQSASVDEPSEDGEGWFQSVEMSGVVEVEASYDDSSKASDIVLATAALAIESQVHDWVAAEISFLYEEDDTPLEVDTASITIADPDSNWYVTSGQQYVPFGSFETSMVSDPMTLEIGETRETAILAGMSFGPASGGLYVFNGENQEVGKRDDIDNWGAVLGYESDHFTASVGYINDIGESDGLEAYLDDNVGNRTQDKVSGWSIGGMYTHGRFTLIGEYVAATEDFDVVDIAFDGSGAEVSAWNLELDTEFTLLGKDAVFAIAYQGTDEAVELELPEDRYMAALSVNIFDNTLMAFEWAHDEDYGVSDGGSGDDTNIFTAYLGVEF